MDFSMPTNQSAGVQTVLCLPLLGGVVELGTVDKVEEDLGFVQRVKAFFSGNSLHLLQPQKPALSAHSTCGSATSFDLRHTFNSPPLLSSAIADGEEEDNEDVSDSEAETERCGFPDSMADATVSGPSDIMQMEVEDTRVGSPRDRSENLESDFQLVDVYGQEKQTAEEILGSKEEVGDPYRSGIQVQASGTYPLEDQLAMEDDRYSETVSTILQNQSSRWANSSTARSTSYPTQSAFSSWTSRHDPDHLDTIELEGTSQWVLKYVLFTVPLLHAKQHDENFSTLRFRKGTPQDDFNTNHVIAERRRREKLNERFIILRSLVPFVTKMDKASILGGTIEYVKQLCKKIQDLEACNRLMEADRRSRSPSSERQNTNSWKLQTSGVTRVDDGGASSYETEKRKMRRVAEGSGRVAMPPTTLDAPASPPSQISREADVQVSIIGSDALLEIQCQHQEGLLLDVMQMLRELLIEITTIQSSSSNGVFVAELKAKVKENSSGKRASIVEVKKALQRIIPHSDT